MSTQTKVRILVVNQDIHEVNYLKNVLEKQHYHVLTAFDSTTSIEIAINIVPDIILLELELPGQDGIDTCRTLRLNELTQYIPVIILSHCKSSESKTRALQSGADDYLCKPIVESELMSRLASILRIKEFEKQNAKTSKELLALYADRISLIESLVMGVTHEVNNPLSAISGYAHLLMKDKDPDSEEYQNLSVIKSESLRIGANISKLLKLIQTDTDNFGTVNAVETLLSAITMSRSKSEQKKVAIQTQIAEQNAETFGDAIQLSQAFYNVISNAVDFSSEDQSVWIKLDTNANNIIISISDSGPGIPEENRMRIFHPFFTTKAVGEGSGLGLSIAESVINRHNGKIIVNTLTGRGTTVDIVLPRRHIQRKIMIVEDEATVLGQLSLILQHFGYQVVGAENAQEAIKLANETKPDLVIMDFKIPQLDGLETAKCIKSIPGLQDIVLIGYTAFGHDANLKQAEIIGFNDILHKPSDLVTIKNVISKYI